MKERIWDLFEWLDRSTLVMRIKYRLERCMKPGCWNRGQECFYPPDESDDLYEMKTDIYYCPKHSADEGFCWSCGQFWAGVESFDFSPIRGICPNCIDEFEDEIDDDFDDGLEDCRIGEFWWDDDEDPFLGDEDKGVLVYGSGPDEERSAI